MTDRPLISIITPFLNREDFLEEAVRSVLAQSYQNWELLLVDDGSTDGSARLARQYAQRYPERIFCFEHEGRANRGPSASRGLALRHARGEWIACLDSDDVWFPNKLEAQLDLLRAHPEAAMIINASEYWHGWTGRPDDIARDRVLRPGGTQDAVTPPPRLVEELYPLGPGRAPCVASIMVRAETLKRTGGWEEHVKDPYEDQYFLTKIYLIAPVYISTLCLDRYRVHPSSFMNTQLAGENYDRVRLRYLEWFERYLAQRGYRYGRIGWRLQGNLLPYRHPRIYRLWQSVRGAMKTLRRFRRRPRIQRLEKRLKKSMERGRKTCRRLRESIRERRRAFKRWRRSIRSGAGGSRR
jgi:glycosyltransferase involved in cell wall biosynthesis